MEILPNLVEFSLLNNYLGPHEFLQNEDKFVLNLLKIEKIEKILELFDYYHSFEDRK